MFLVLALQFMTIFVREGRAGHVNLRLMESSLIIDHLTLCFT
jgi:hypothetical protein